MRIADTCTHNVIHVDTNMSVPEAAQLMRRKHVGTLVVVEQPDGERMPIGIVTDRDIVVSVVAAGVEAESLTVNDIMTRKPATCSADQELFDAIQTMRTFGVRRLPVVNRQGGLVGMLAADDIFAALGMHLSELGRAMSHEQTQEMETRP